MVTVTKLPSPGNAKPIRIDNYADFNGGLNTTANRFDLGASETPDCNDVDIDRRGGIIRRGAATQLSNNSFSESWQPHYMQPFVKNAGSSAERLYDGFVVYTSLTGAPTLANLAGGACLSASVGAKTYVFGYDPLAAGYESSAPGDTYSLNESFTKSSAYTVSGVGRWQDSYASPSGAHAPVARAACAHLEHCFVGYTGEYTGLPIPQQHYMYPNRLRWSHPGDGGSWREDDYIDVGSVNEPIVGLVSCADHLLILKRSSVWVLHGYNTDTFNLIQVAEGVGISGGQAFTQLTPRGVFFSDSRKGLHVYQNNSVRWLAEKVISYWPAYTPPTSSGSYHAAVAYGMYETAAVGYSAETDRVWVSLPDSTSRATDPPANAFSLVYDPQTESWTKNNIRAMGFVMFRGKFCGILSGLFHVEDYTAVADTYLGSTQNIAGYWVSAWHMGSQPVVPKRWLKPEFVITGNQVGTFTVSVYKDYDPITVEKTITISMTNPLSSSTDYDEVKRTQTLGTAKAISFKFAGPTSQNVNWRLDAYALKHRQKAVRS